MKKVCIDNPRYPHHVKIIRKHSISIDEEDPLSESTADDEILYEGEARSYTDTTTNGNNDVDINRRKSSVPVRFDEWSKDKLPLNGDTIISTVGENTETGMIRDCEGDNNRSVIYWDFVRV